MWQNDEATMQRDVVLWILAAGHVPALMVGQLLLKEWEMPPARTCPTLSAIALWMAACVAAGVSTGGWPIASRAVAQQGGDGPTPVQLGANAPRNQAPNPTANPTANPAANPGPIQTSDQDRQRSDRPALEKARGLLAAGYKRAPALLIALCAFVVLPVVALISLLVQWTAGRRRRSAAIRAAELRAADAEPVGDMPAASEMPLWCEEAWLTVEGPGPRTLPLDSRLIRIGRDQENDVRLPDATVHRYHAVIERTPEAAFVIVDISGEEGNGVLINGARQSRARLCDGDVIKLGRTCLKFESPSP
jgi:FHA domain